MPIAILKSRKKPIKILIIEDNPGDAGLIKQYLRDSPFLQVTCFWAQRLSEAQKYLEAENFDVILLDLSLPDSQGLETMAKLDRKLTTTPIVILTGLQDEALGIEAVHRGAQDYVYKDKLTDDLLSRVIQYAIERHQLQTVKDDFVAMVSHELRTPLTIVRESISQILEGLIGQITEEQKQRLSMALTSTDRLSRMISNLLDVAKIEAQRLELKKEIVNVADIAKEVISIFQRRAQTKGLKILEDFPNDTLEFYADKDKMIQVFTNLIGNAIKFTPKGYVEVSAVNKGEFIECSVLDTGPGIAPEDLEKIFDKFQQLGQTPGPEQGTGLGLVICKGIVESHHGRIWVESPSPLRRREGKDAQTLPYKTKFTFTLPRYKTIEVFKEYLMWGIKEAKKEASPLSAVVFEIKDSDEIERELGKEKMVNLFDHLAKRSKQSLRRQSDTVIKGTDSLFVVLPLTQKADAVKVVERIQQAFDHDLSSETGGPLFNLERGQSIKILWRLASYPEDGITEEELLKAIMPKR